MVNYNAGLINRQLYLLERLYEKRGLRVSMRSKQSKTITRDFFCFLGFGVYLFEQWIIVTYVHNMQKHISHKEFSYNLLHHISAVSARSLQDRSLRQQLLL